MNAQKVKSVKCHWQETLAICRNFRENAAISQQNKAGRLNVNSVRWTLARLSWNNSWTNDVEGTRNSNRKGIESNWICGKIYRFNEVCPWSKEGIYSPQRSETEIEKWLKWKLYAMSLKQENVCRRWVSRWFIANNFRVEIRVVILIYESSLIERELRGGRKY